MFYHRRLLNHFTHINNWLVQNDAQSNLDMRTFRVEATAYGQSHVLQPQFLFENGDQFGYRPNLGSNVTGFIGWLPYFLKRWPTGTDKMAFKRYVVERGKRTPPFWLDSESMPEDVLIKPLKGSFGNGMRGPFKKIDLVDPAQRLGEGEYYERFRQGRILKVWYWNDQPVCVELRDPPLVHGDGVRTIFQLAKETYRLEDKALRRYEARRGNLLALLIYQSVDWETVLPEGQTVQVDYLYGSSLYPESSSNANQLGAIQGSALAKEIYECGPIFWDSLSEDVKQNTLYAVDGMVDTSEQIRWLELNCNPICPPDAYALILDSMFKR